MIPSIDVESQVGTPEWMISLGKQFHACGMVFIQLFMVAKFIMYIILFKDLYQHNKELQNVNSLGLSATTLQNRQRKNVITLSGQCFHFVIEMIICFIIYFAIQMNFSALNIRLCLGTLLVAFYFVASPELKRFYFGKTRFGLPLNFGIPNLTEISSTNWEINTTCPNSCVVCK